MCLSVFANGVGKGKDTDVSVFANLMCGKYDDYYYYYYFFFYNKFMQYAKGTTVAVS